MAKFNRSDNFNRHWILDAVLGSIGIGIFAFAVKTISLPNGLASGGFTNFGLIAHHLFGFDTGLVFWFLSTPLLLIAWKKLGRREAIMTLIVMNALTLWLMLFGNFAMPQFIFSNLIVSGLIAGLLQGIGGGIVLLSVTTSGGGLLTGRLGEAWFKLPVDYGVLAVDIVGMGIAILTFLNIGTAFATLISLFIFAKIARLIARPDYRRKIFQFIRPIKTRL